MFSEWQIDLTNDEGEERVDFDFTTYLGGYIRLSAWEDGRMRFRSCKPGSRRAGGWEFQIVIDLSAKEARPEQIVDTFERSRYLSDLEPMLRIWARFDPEPDRLIGLN